MRIHVVCALNRLRFLLALVLLPAACGPAEAPKGAKQDILVGEYASMTGSEATFGISTHDGIMLAVEEINAAGGINGRKVRIITEDDQSKPEEAVNAVTKLIAQHGVVAILGEVASSNSLAAAPECQRSRVPMLTPSSTSPLVTRVGDYIFRACFIDAYQGPVMARYMRDDLKVKTAALFTDTKSDHSRGLGESFSKTFESLGGTVVARQFFAKGDSDFRSQLTAIRAADPDVVFVPAYYNDVALIARQARDLGLKQPLVGGDGWESPKLLELGGDALNGSYYSNHYFVDDTAPAVRNFVDRYGKKYGAKPDSLAALGYDAMHLLAAAMRRARTIDSQSIRDQLAATRGFVGVTGMISMGPDRNPIGKKIIVQEVVNGTLTLKKTIDPM